MTATDKPDDWQFEMPQYRALRDFRPPAFSRHHFDQPWSNSSDDSCWQYARTAIRAGQVISSGCWPPPSGFRPLNESARRVSAFFAVATRSRLARMPWQNDRIVLDDGLGGSAQVTLVIKTGDAA